MTTQDSDKTFLKSSDATKDGKSAKLESIQKWIDHSSWNPVGTSRDVAECWGLLGGDSQIPAASESKDIAEPQVSVQTATRFIPKQIMGVGAFGVVIKVDDQQLQRPAALKILRPSLGTSPKLIARFIREARTVAAIEHTAIVRIYETGSIGGRPFIAVELVDGPDLAKYSRLKQQSMSFRQSVWLIQKVTAAVQFAHSRGVLHRDLKPSNILLASAEPSESEGLGFTPRLTDFGLAKLIGAKSVAVVGVQENLTGEAQFLGTVRYTSPEQASGRMADVGIASDVFSLGVILFELLTGKLPFDSVSDQDVLHQISHVAPTRPRKLVSSIPRDLEAIVLKAIEKNPEDRYATAGELHADLTKFMHGEPVAAARYSYVRQITFQARKHPVATTALLSATLAVLSAAGLVTRAWLNERNARAGELAANAHAATIQLAQERDQDQALNTVNDTFFRLAEMLNNGEPITHSQRIELLKKAVDFHEEFLAGTPLDITKRHRLSIAYHHLGNEYENSGHIDEAIDARMKTKRLLEGLLLDKPEHPKLLFQLSTAHLNLSNLLIIKQEPAASLSSIAKAMTILETLVAQYPRDIDYAEVLIAVRTSAANLETDIDRQEQIFNSVVQQAIALWESNKEQPRCAKYGVNGLLSCAELSLKQGDALRAYDRVVAASGFFEQVFATLRKEAWVEKIERNMLRRTEWVLVKMGKWNELAEYAQRGIELEKPEELTEEPHVFATYKIIHLRMLAIALRQLGKVDAAIVALEEAILLESDFRYSREVMEGMLEDLEEFEALPIGDGTAMRSLKVNSN